MTEFYSPYYFIPATHGGRRGDLNIASLRNGSDPAALLLDGMRHDRYEGDKHSGVIFCTVEAKSPIFIGDEKPEGSEEVLGFKLEGIPALPASSLRGMVSSIAEAASNSALRILTREVLGEECYSYRKPMNKAFTAIGKLIKNPDGWVLEPICLPALRYNMAGNLRPEMNKWRTVFASQPVFRIYLGRTADEIRGRASHGPWAFRTNQVGKVGLQSLSWSDVSTLVPGSVAYNALRVKDTDQHGHPIAATVVAQKNDSTKPKQTAVIRVLGCYERDIAGNEIRQIPDTKRHELVLPYKVNRFPVLRVPDQVVQRFQQLANQMTEDSKTEASPRPYEPKDTRPGRRSEENLEPQTGDLVYFDVNNAATEVTEFSYSSIWRGRVEASGQEPANAWTFFEGIDENLAPFNRRRSTITLAERIFGFIEQDDGKESTNGLHWKGRVRFSHGIAVTPIDELDLVPLKELSGPKPPSPVMYFRYPHGPNRHIAKTELAPRTHWPQGRKFYLHHPGAITGNMRPWEGQQEFEASRHVRIRPWGKGGKWRFEIRFDNLNDLELGLLLYALKPTDTFLHKLGMGKPIGLGSVVVTIDCVRTVDRIARYSAEGWGRPRFKEGSLDWSVQRDEFINGMNAEIRAALETLGDPNALRANIPIGYPSCDGAQTENNHYEWFVSNEERARGTGRGGPPPEALQPVTVAVPGNQAQGQVKPLRKLPAPHPH